METTHRIILGDSRRLPELPDRAVQLVVTSPPYWQLKDYGIPGQLGFDHCYEDYINHLGLVWQECIRVLHPGCRLCINIGDQFARAAVYGRYRVLPIRTEIIKFCLAAGLDYLGAVIWRKVTSTHTTGGGSVMGSFPYPRNGILKLDYEFILIFRKPGRAPRPSPEVRERSRLSTGEWNQLFSGHWQFPGERQRNHLAAFPEELPSRLIRMFSFVGDTVLDPFLGSGTTTLAAARLERHSVGCEIDPGCLEPILQRLERARRESDAGWRVEVERRTEEAEDYRRELLYLPYRFRDPDHLQRQADPRELELGARVGHTRSAREEYFRVREVLSPELLRLEDGRMIRLIGVRELPPAREAALAWLRERTRAARVYLKLDLLDLPTAEETPAYLYLENRTCLNSRMIRQGLAAADTETDYNKRQRFISLRPAAPAP